MYWTVHHTRTEHVLRPWLGILYGVNKARCLLDLAVGARASPLERNRAIRRAWSIWISERLAEGLRSGWDPSAELLVCSAMFHGGSGSYIGWM